MMLETRILSAIKDSGVKNIVLLDDAFDPPQLNPENAGLMLGYVQSEGFAEICRLIGIADADRGKLETALQENDFESKVIAATMDKLYTRYREKRDGRFDPGGKLFKDAKGDMLAALDPLTKLLSKSEVTVQHVGHDGELKDPENVDIIFADYFLLEPGKAIADANAKQEGFKASYDKVLKFVEKARPGRRPSVVLMSSEDKSAEAEAYRKLLSTATEHDLIYSSNFAFLLKQQIAMTGANISAEPDAADALLDTFQAFEFGRFLHEGLDTWINSAQGAIANLRNDIAKLRVKDYAYLVKFRLMAEGEGLLEYLEWFFAECLADAVVEAFDKTDVAKSWDRAANEKAASRLEGAFDGPTDQVAELYHRVRVARARPNRTTNYRLGDLYASPDLKSVSAIMNAECDLILRKGRRKAKRILTVEGQLKALNTPASSVADFLRIPDANGKLRSYLIDWDEKHVRSHETEEGLPEGDRREHHFPSPGHSNASFKHVGTLKPLYANEIQRSVLSDLGRPALPIAPAIAMAASCALHVVMKDDKVARYQIGKAEEAQCWVIHDEKRPMVVFARRAVTEIIKILGSMDWATTKTAPARALKPGDLDKFYNKLCGNDLALPDSFKEVEIAAIAPKDGSTGRIGWLVIEGIAQG